MGRMTDQEYVERYRVYRAKKWYGQRWAAAATIIFLIVIIAWGLNQMDAKIQKTWSVVKADDYLYVDTASLRDTNFTGVTLYRQVRAINAAEIRKLHIPKWEKDKRILQLDTSSGARKPSIITANISVDRDLIFKYRSSIIGTFVRRDSTAEYFEDRERGLSSHNKWYGIKPNKKLCTVDPDFKLPKNYVYADDLYYVDAVNVILNGELSMFAKQK